MQRQHTMIGNSIPALALGLGLALVLAAPAALGEVYAWRTEDGGYAYTDDRDNVPARYAQDVQVIESRRLSDYERFTPQDGAASARYAERLAARLAYLRAMNAPAPQAGTPAVAAAAVSPQRTISLSTGERGAPEIQVPFGQGEGPIVVEPVKAKSAGDARTRRVTVVRQGDETIAVIKGVPHHFNVLDDIHDEDELDAGASLR